MNGDTTVNDVTPPRKTPLLCHVTDPEDKRRIIGDTFMRVANKVIEDLSLNPDEVLLSQGEKYVTWKDFYLTYIKLKTVE